ncbi:hypothetical protein [Sphingobacterium rhinopitheci]|uniref:hypothetical protein n=1 Tax=Sphingobacterium rhinopitheci TaxID=2781960 RepID=UPI001F520F37|nr:hypothetical protein [Sphingobacterium rhinopitheci]MCI0921245.1 hypothetical protein [Sphingobacterium rhinopitheci]
MSQISYNSKELLSTLIEVEAKLNTVVNNNYSQKDFVFGEDTDAALEQFLQYQNVEDNNAGYISTELAFFYLRKELDKTIDVVIVANDLRAYYDYNKETIGKEKVEVVESSKFTWILIGILIGIAISTIIFYVF